MPLTPVRDQGHAAVVPRPLVGGLLCAIGLALILAEFKRPLNSDSAWLLHVARQVFRGDRLYVDLVEINPPLVVWLQLPVIFLADRLGVESTVAFRMAVLLLIGVSLVLCTRLVAALTPRRGDGVWILVGALAVLLAWTRAHFGEREHIALAAILPFLLASAAVARDYPMGAGLGIAIGGLASIGFAMKPHFLVVWLVALAYLTWTRRDTLGQLRTANRMILALLLLYCILIMVAAPEYLTLIRRLGPTYQAFARKDFSDLVLHSAEALGGIAAVLAYGLTRRSAAAHEAGDILALAILAFLLAVLVQGKGFSYHYYPVSGCTLLLAVVALVGQDTAQMRLTGWVGTLTLGLLLLLGTTSGLLWSLSQLWHPDPLYLQQSRMVRYISERTKDRTVLRLGYEDNFPIVDEAGGRWTMRFPNLWFVQASYAEQLASSREVEYRSPAQMSAAERWCFDAVIEDFVRGRPSLLMVIQPRPPQVSGPTRLDYLAYFSRDARFTTALQSYDLIDTMAGYRVFQRRR